jgi:aspartate-semialdehyde dehydrogenase
MTHPGYTVAVLGATGLVGQKLIQIMAERQFPVARLVPLASERTAGQSILFRGEPVTVSLAEPAAFAGVDLILASAGAKISEALVPHAVAHGAVVVDNTSFYRMQEGVPLVVAGVNDADLTQHQGIIANPNCSTAQLMPVLRALDDAAGLKRVMVSTYQSASGAGKDGMDELATGLGDIANQAFEAQAPHQVFARPLPMNVIPQIDVWLPDGYSKEEWKVMAETRKILHRPELPVSCTAVRVPVMVGHSEAVTVDLNQPLTPEDAIALLKKVPDVVVAETSGAFHTPLETAGTDPVYVSRIRRDTSNPETGLCMWVVADNLRIGAALNAVRIAESLHRQQLISSRAGAAV